MSEHLGLTTIECARVIVAEIPEIQRVNFRGFFNQPDKQSGEDEILFGLDRPAFLAGYGLDYWLQTLPVGWNAAFDSKVEVGDGTIFQLPMTDLYIRKSPDNLTKLIDRFNQLIVPKFGGGFLLETRLSYHFFGRRLLDPEEWQKFLGTCLITSFVHLTPEDQENIHEQVVDYRYIGHSLIRGSTGLRITTNGSKTVLPKVVAII